MTVEVYKQDGSIRNTEYSQQEPGRPQPRHEQTETIEILEDRDSITILSKLT